MSRLAARRRRATDFWPGFVDALAALLMVLVFLLLVFTVGQFALADAISGRDKALTQLNAELAELARALSMERTAKASAESRADELSASLASTREERDQLSLNLGQTSEALQGAQSEAAKLAADLAALNELKAQLEAEIAARLIALDETRNELAAKTELSDRSLAQVELLNRQLSALREQLDALNQALASAKAEAETKDQKIEDLGRELNLALAQRVQELARYRSEFFGRLREVLGARSDIEIVGDRFVLPSGLLFPSASDELSEEGLLQLGHLAETIKQIQREIPADLDWVLRIDGHTDRLPISTARYPSNWELSSARAIAIVKYLIAQGIPAQRLSANGFGEHRPLDRGSSEQALARNRRIEIQLTNR